MSEKSDEFNLRVTEDGLSVLLNCDAPQDDLDPFLDAVETRLKDMKITAAYDRDGLKDMLHRALQNGNKLSGERVAVGVEPTPPRAAELSWAGDFFASGFVADETTGRIDYRRRSAQPSVKEGQLLATLTPPKEGKSGLDVFGNRILAEKPDWIHIRIGLNVREERTDGIHNYYAKTGGRVRWTQDTISVEPVLTIAGNVGLKTGDISHTAAVIIEGNVLAGSRVVAQGDIDIHGSVESSNIQTEGNLNVDEGITGSEGRKIVVGGSIRSKHLLEVEIEAGEDIVVESEIIHSSIKTRGRLHMPEGRLIGGEVMALKGIDLGEAGSEAFTPTRLIPGADYRLTRELAPKNRELAKYKERLGQIQNATTSLSAWKNTLTPKQREILTELHYQIGVFNQNIERLEREIRDLTEDAKTRAKFQIAIKSKLFPDTTIFMKHAKLMVREEFDGPLRVGFAKGHILIRNERNEVAQNESRVC